MQWDLISKRGKKKKRAKAEKNIELPLLPKCVPQRNFFLSKTDCQSTSCLKYCKLQVSKQERTSLLACWASLKLHQDEKADVVILAITVETLTCYIQPSRLRELETEMITASLSPSASTPCLVPSLPAPTAPQTQDWGLLFLGCLWNIIISHLKITKKEKVHLRCEDI